MEDRWEFYVDVFGEWRWRRTGSDGKVPGISKNGFRNMNDCRKNAGENGYEGVMEGYEAMTTLRHC